MIYKIPKEIFEYFKNASDEELKGDSELAEELLKDFPAVSEYEEHGNEEQ